jgi:transposase
MSYLKEFKLDVVSLMLDQSYARTDTARSLDINAHILGQWVK